MALLRRGAAQLRPDRRHTATGHGEEARRIGHTTWGSLAILSYDREHWALHSHAGYRHNRNTLGQRKSLWHISAALWVKPTQALKVVVDQSYDTNPDPSSNTTVRQTVLGIIYSITPHFNISMQVCAAETSRQSTARCCCSA